MQVAGEQQEVDGGFEELAAFVRNHAEIAAERAQGKLGGPLTSQNLSQFLSDTDCLRCKTTLEFSEEGLEPHQFAEPYFDDAGGTATCCLHIRPTFSASPEAWPYFVAYLAAVINYGQVVAPDICEFYGARLMGLSEDDFYARLCAFVDGPKSGEG
jgi:hypothetical protein